MDTNLLTIIISAAIVLAGVFYFVFMWRRQPTLGTIAASEPGPGEARPRSEKQVIYQQLWNRVDTLHALVRRSEDISTAEFRAQLAEVDRFIRQQARVVDQQDSELARRYLAALRTLKDQINPPGEVRKGQNVQETRRLPRELVARTGEITESTRAVEQLRGELLARFHIIINAKA